MTTFKQEIGNCIKSIPRENLIGILEEIVNELALYIQINYPQIKHPGALAKDFAFHVLEEVAKRGISQ